MTNRNQSAKLVATWEANATVMPIAHTGTQEDCEAWMNAMSRQEVFVVDADGVRHVVGIVSQIEMRKCM